MTPPFARFALYAVGFLFGVWGGTALAAQPRDELLRIVPEDTTFTLLIQNLAEKSKALDESPFMKELDKTPLGKILLRTHDPETEKQIGQLLADFGLTPEQLVFDLFGDAVVLAFRDRDETKKDATEAMVFMLHARDPKLLAKVVERINAYEQKSGELKEVVGGEYQKRAYSRRVKTNPEEGDEFYFLSGSVFVFSTSEPMLRTAIDRDLKEPAVKKQKPALAERFERLGVEKSLVVWWMNPRAFDREFQALVERAQGIEKTMLAQFSQIWKGFDGVAVHFDYHDSFEFGAMVSIDKARLPKSAQPFFAEVGKPSALWQVIPENALFALATRIEGSSLLEMISGLFDAAHRQQVESAVLDLLRVLRPEQLRMLPRGLGPDVGFWVFDPLEDPKKKIWVPQMLLAIKLRSGSEGTESGENLQMSFGLLAGFARLLNGNISVVSSKEEEVTYLIYDRGFPSGFRPAFGSKAGYFLLSASPESIRNFTPPKHPEVKEESEVPFLRVSLKSWKKFLGDHRDSMAQFIAQGNGDLAKEIASQLDQFIENLGVFDRLEVVQKNRPDAIGIVVRLKTAQALRK